MTTLGSVTISDVVSFNPCDSSSAQNIQELFAGRETINALDIFNMGIPFDHKIWLAIRPELIDQDTLDLIKEDFLLLMTDHDNSFYQSAIDAPSRKIVNKFIRYSNQQYETLTSDLENTITNVILNRIN